jgi:hypothetical protein
VDIALPPAVHPWHISCSTYYIAPGGLATRIGVETPKRYCILYIIWRYVNRDERGETMEEGKKEVPVKTDRLEEQLKEWGVDLEKLKLRANKVRADAKTEIDREIATLRAKLNEAQKKLVELKTAGGAASVEMRKGVENAWVEMKKAFENATAKFK